MCGWRDPDTGETCEFVVRAVEEHNANFAAPDDLRLELVALVAAQGLAEDGVEPVGQRGAMNRIERSRT